MILRQTKLVGVAALLNVMWEVRLIVIILFSRSEIINLIYVKVVIETYFVSLCTPHAVHWCDIDESYAMSRV